MPGGGGGWRVPAWPFLSVLENWMLPPILPQSRHHPRSPMCRPGGLGLVRVVPLPLLVALAARLRDEEVLHRHGHAAVPLVPSWRGLRLQFIVVEGGGRE